MRFIGAAPKSSVWFVGCIIASVLLYLPALDNGFREDDFVFLNYVQHVSWQNVMKGDSTLFAFYRPGALALFKAEYALFGLHSGAYIFINILMHIATGILGFLIVTRQKIQIHTGLTAMMLFLFGYAHYGKQIMWACASGPIASILLVLTALVYLGNPRAKGFGRREMFACLLLLIAPAFHESGIVTVWLALMLRPKSRSMLQLAIVFAAISAFWLIVRVNIAHDYKVYDIGMHTFLAGMHRVVRYAGFICLPLQSSWIPVKNPLIVPLVQLGVGAAMLLGIAAMWVRRQKRWLVVWFLIAIAPGALVTVPEGWLELRYVYNAAFPWCVMVALILSQLSVRLRIAVLVALLAASISLQVVLENKYDRVSGSLGSWNRTGARARTV